MLQKTLFPPQHPEVETICQSCKQPVLGGGTPVIIQTAMVIYVVWQAPKDIQVVDPTLIHTYSRRVYCDGVGIPGGRLRDQGRRGCCMDQ